MSNKVCTQVMGQLTGSGKQIGLGNVFGVSIGEYQAPCKGLGTETALNQL